MPAMANIVVKDAANVDVTYSAATPSAGDRSPAVWRANALSAAIAFRPLFSFMTRDNQKQNGRAVEARFSFPIHDVDANGNPILLAKVPFVLTGTLPTNVDATLVADATVQFGNLLVSSLIRAAFAEGYAPT